MDDKVKEFFKSLFRFDTHYLKNFFESLFHFDKIFGKKLLLIVYYAVTAAIGVNAVVSFINGIVYLFVGNPLEGLWKIIFCIPLAIINFLILRLVCEIISLFFDKFDK